MSKVNKPCVLLIEPDQILANIYSKALVEAGYMVVHSRGAQSAVHDADDTKPDLVVLELQLPGHSGVEFLYEFRSYEEWQEVPVLLHTFVPEQAVTLPEQLRVAKHLYKPDTSLGQLVAAADMLMSAKV